MRTMHSVRASNLFRYFVYASMLATAALESLGCNEAPLIPAPDAGVKCTAPQLEAPCVALDAGLPGCSNDLQSDAVLGQEVKITPGSYPAGCTVIVNSTSLDQDNQCLTLGSCNCQQADAGTFDWVCFE